MLNRPPVVGDRLFADRQALAQDGLGLRPFRLLQEVQPEPRELKGQGGTAGFLGLAAAVQVVAPERLGVGPAARAIRSPVRGCCG